MYEENNSPRYAGYLYPEPRNQGYPMSILGTKSLPELRTIAGAAAARVKAAKNEVEFQQKVGTATDILFAKQELGLATVSLNLANFEIWYAMEMAADASQRQNIAHAAMEAGLIAA
jgi:hypothetical protein